jgi:hypothetical protein
MYKGQVRERDPFASATSKQGYIRKYRPEFTFTVLKLYY